MRQAVTEFVQSTHGQRLHEFTAEVARWVGSTGIREGLLTLQVRHTSASLLIQENADPEVQRDLERFFARLVPRGDPIFRHTMEGPDDMPAHVRSMLTSTSLGLPVVGGSMTLGTWQGIYLYEHRDAPHRRTVVGHIIGE